MRIGRSISKTGLSLFNLQLTLGLGALTLAVYLKESGAVPIVIKDSNVGQGAPASATGHDDANRFDALPVPRSVRRSSLLTEVNGTRQNDKRDGDAGEMNEFRRHYGGADADSMPFASARIPEARKLDFDPSPLQPNDIHAKRHDEEDIPLNSELDLSNDYGQDKDNGNGDADYIYFVPQLQRPAQKELPTPSPTPASITVLLATEEETEEEKATAETQISDLSQGDFNSSKTTFSSPSPTSSERVNLIPDSRESQTANLVQTKEVTRPARDSATEGSQIPLSTSVLGQQEEDERKPGQIEPPTALLAVDESSAITDQPSKDDLANSLEEGENKRHPLLTLLYYKETDFDNRDAATMVDTQRPQHDRVTILRQQHYSSRNESSVGRPQVEVNVKGDRSGIDDDSKSAVSFHQITKETKISTRKPVDSVTINVLRFGFVLFSLLTLAAAVMTNLNNHTTHRHNGLRLANDITSFQSRYPAFELSDHLNHEQALASRWLASSSLHRSNARRRPSFHLGDETFSDEDD